MTPNRYLVNCGLLCGGIEVPSVPTAHVGTENDVWPSHMPRDDSGCHVL